ncbi:MAG: hypothetical protein QOG53_1349 [Frankiales bacterium]|jgi:hypothetical protein|nr:hypothetical protein [Frankiales bacterium]
MGRLLSPNTEVNEPVVLTLAVAAVVTIGVLATEYVGTVPLGGIVVPTLVAGMFLRTRSLVFLDAASAAVVIYYFVQNGFTSGRVGITLVIAITAAFAHLMAASRQRVGLQGLRGDTMLADLRDRLNSQGQLPALPAGWQAQAALRSAGGASFGGDFVVAALTDDDKRLEIAVVDVSGKGVDAATRALQLSGALGGLLGALPPDQFLVAANRYLLRQNWHEGFATAVHLTIDLVSGEFSIASAGHPPAAQFDAGSGRWGTVDVDGPMLGLLPHTSYVTQHGVVRHGDALLLYTDGLIEVPGRDLAMGVDKLLGEAERLVTLGFEGGAQYLIDAVDPLAADDGAVVLVNRF